MATGPKPGPEVAGDRKWISLSPTEFPGGSQVVIIGSPGRDYYPIHVAKYGEPIAARTGYPTLVLCNPDTYPDGSDIEQDIGILSRLARETGQNYYNMNCQLAVVYIQAMNAFQQFLGLEGLEAAYDKNLLGRGGYLVMERDALGRGIGAGIPEVQGATRRHDLHLTIDENLQYIADRELAVAIQEYNARAGVWSSSSNPTAAASWPWPTSPSSTRTPSPATSGKTGATGRSATLSNLAQP